MQFTDDQKTIVKTLAQKIQKRLTKVYANPVDFFTENGLDQESFEFHDQLNEGLYFLSTKMDRIIEDPDSFSQMHTIVYNLMMRELNVTLPKDGSEIEDEWEPYWEIFEYCLIKSNIPQN